MSSFSFGGLSRLLGSEEGGRARRWRGADGLVRNPSWVWLSGCLAVWLQVGAALASTRTQSASDWRPACVTDGEEARNAFPKHAVAPNGGLGRRTPELGEGGEKA